MTKFQQYARDNYKPGSEIDDMWHPEIQAECRVMNAEAEAKKSQDRAKIKQVVESVADAEKELTGSIVIFVKFNGSLPKVKPLTPAEKAKVFDAAKVSTTAAKKLKGNKPLFGEFPELDDLNDFITRSRDAVKRFGIPFIGDGMTVLGVNVIPDVEDHADMIDEELPKAVEKMLAAYPNAIAKDVVYKDVPDLAFLHNPNDYPPVEAIRKLFKWDRKWLYPGVPDVLKEVDKARWERERKRALEVWAEIKQGGIVLLRKQLAEMTERLVESVKPGDDGKKKRFYETTITTMTEFFEQFDRRNISGDTELAEVVADLKKLISNKDIDDFKTDDTLRAKVASSGASITKQLQTMITEAENRVITFED